MGFWTGSGAGRGHEWKNRKHPNEVCYLSVSNQHGFRRFDDYIIVIRNLVIFTSGEAGRRVQRNPPYHLCKFSINVKIFQNEKFKIE